MLPGHIVDHGGLRSPLLAAPFDKPDKQQPPNFDSTEHVLSRSAQADHLGEWAWVNSVPLAASRDVHSNALGRAQPGCITTSLPSQPRGTASSDVHISSQQFRVLRSAARQFVRDHRRLLAHQVELLSMRSQNTYERQECMERHRHLSETQHDLGTMLSITDNRQIDGSGILEINRLRQQMHSDFKALQLYDARTRASEAELAKREFQVREKESALASIADRLIQEMRRSNLAYDNYGPNADDDQSSLATLRSLALQAASPRLPTALDEYYDKAGQVNWKRERVHGLMHELRHARVDRVLTQDHGDEIDVSDASFEADYAEKLLTAQNALDLALEELDRAKENCVRQGLDPDLNYIHGDFAELESSTEDDGLPEVVEHSTFPVPNRETSSSPPLMLRSAPLPTEPPQTQLRRNRGSVKARDRVAKWIQAIGPFPQDLSDSASMESERKEKPTSSWLSSISYLGQEPLRDKLEIRQRLGRTLKVDTGLERSVSEPIMRGRKLGKNTLRQRRSLSEPGLRAARQNSSHDLCSSRRSLEYG